MTRGQRGLLFLLRTFTFYSLLISWRTSVQFFPFGVVTPFWSLTRFLKLQKCVSTPRCQLPVLNSIFRHLARFFKQISFLQSEILASVIAMQSVKPGMQRKIRSTQMQTHCLPDLSDTATFDKARPIGCNGDSGVRNPEKPSPRVYHCSCETMA
jgi:hypothetical protein